MVSTFLLQFIALLLPLTSAAELARRQVRHLVEDAAVMPRELERRAGAEAIPTKFANATATTTTKVPSTITPAAAASFPRYTNLHCTPPAGTASSWCAVNMWNVQVHFWPTSLLNVSYPSTYYASEYDVTMTSPSVYYIVSMAWATNACRTAIADTQTNLVFAYDLDQVSTYLPYENATVSTRMGGGQAYQLELNDLKSDCPLVSSIPNWENHNTNKDGCNPVLEFREDLKDAAAYGAWKTCQRFGGGTWGVYDPPVPIAPCTKGDECGNVPLPSTSAAPIASPTAEAVVADPTTTQTSSAKPSQTVAPIASTSSPNKIPTTTLTPEVAKITNPSTVPLSSPSSEVPADTPVPQTNPSTSAIATPANSAVISAAPGDSNVVIGTQTLSQGAEPITIPGGEIASLVSSAIIVSNSDSGAVNIYSIPSGAEASPTPAQSFGVVAGQTISGAAIGSSAAVVGEQTLSLGGAEVTLSGGQVASLASEGVVIQAPSGVISTFSVPAAKTTADIVAPTVGVIGEQTIEAAAVGSSAAVVNGQTISVGGAAVTLSGGHVASLASAVLIVQGPSGVVSTFSVPSVTTTPVFVAESIGVIAGQTISGVAVGSSAAVVGGQTLSYGAAPVTLEGGQVASLGSSGLVVQAPSGVVTTLSILIPTSTKAAASLTGNGSGLGNKVEFPATSSTSGGTSATGLGAIIYNTFEGDGAILRVAGFAGWLGCVMVGFVLGI